MNKIMCRYITRYRDKQEIEDAMRIVNMDKEISILEKRLCNNYIFCHSK